MTTTYNAAIPYNSVLNYDGGAVVISSDDIPTWQLEVENPFTGTKGPLPEAIIDQMSFESSAPSAISFAAPNDSVGGDQLDDLMIVNLKANGANVLDGRWLLRGQGWDAGRKAQTKKWTGRHLLWDRLEHTVIQPGVRKLYSAKTPGYILNDLFLDAQARDVGYWSDFTWTFDVAKDSNGNSWPVTLGGLEYLPSAKYADIVANLVDKGVIEISLLGNEIRVTVPNTDGVVTAALLVVGQDVTDAPQQSSADNLVSDIVVLGDDGVAVVRANTETRAAYWREEAGISQGGTKDEGTLAVFGDVALSTGDAPRVQRTYALVVTQERPFLPLRDYAVGDWVRSQHGDDTPAQSYRVKQIVLKQEKGNWGGTLVLNDKFLENELRLTKKVDGIIGGATITGSSQTSTPDDLKDDTVPTPPTGVTGSSAAYVDSNGVTRAQASFAWDPPLTNTDGSVANDIDHYRVAYRYSEDTIWQWQDTDETQWFISPLDPGRDLLFFVRAIDTTGHWSGNQPQPYVLHTGSDTVAPPAPSTGTVASILGSFVFTWDGLTTSGALMPSDFKQAQLYASKVNDFNVDLDGQLVDSLRGAGTSYFNINGAQLGETWYFKTVASDNSGNRSPASAQASVVLQGVTGPDIVAGSITTNELAVGAVHAQNIETGAITAEKINIGQTVNLCQDPSFNNPDWRARRLTTEWAEQPLRWFFTDQFDFIKRNGYYLQALSRPDGVNGGRMYMCDWIDTQVGESYYFGVYASSGQFDPNPEATLRLGVEVTFEDGTVSSDGINYLTFHRTWLKYGYRFTIINTEWIKVRFYIQAMDMNAGDIAIDDVEIRGGVGTTEYSGSRGLIDPQGFYAYDADDNQTFLVDFRTGDVAARGEISSGFTGKRTVINPGGTYLPEIRFYPSSGDQYAYINATEASSFPFIGINAPDSPTDDPTNAMVLYDTSFALGAIKKSTAQINVGIEGNGNSGASGTLWFHGKIGNAYNTNGSFATGKFNLGDSPGSGSGTVIGFLGKPVGADPSSGAWHLFCTTYRTSAEKIQFLITAETATNFTVAYYPIAATWVSQPGRPFILNYWFVRA